MCGMCSDHVETCYECPRTPSNTYGRYIAFYLGDDNMCDHMLTKYGTRNASLLDHVRRDHDQHEYRCRDNCISEQWWDREEVINCVNMVYET